MSRKPKLILITSLLILVGITLSLFNDSIRAAFVIGKKPNTAGASPNIDSLSQGLVGYWSFDEDAGTTVPDHSGNGNTGAATGGPTGTTGQLGRALSFDGSNDYVDMGEVATLGTNTDKTVSMWVKIDTKTEAYRIFTKNKNTSALGYGFAYDTTGDAAKLTAFFNDGTEMTASFGNISVGTWHYLTAVYSESAGTVTA